ncbi:hypothetical protein R1flu_024480 [Riccia fluitans]|uniref:Uncharacterized protein n=1 Tax=Riccia fluitans TaxID=41844 RepID=A0ABD1XV03_9MARC
MISFPHIGGIKLGPHPEDRHSRRVESQIVRQVLDLQSRSRRASKQLALSALSVASVGRIRGEIHSRAPSCIFQSHLNPEEEASSPVRSTYGASPIYGRSVRAKAWSPISRATRAKSPQAPPPPLPYRGSSEVNRLDPGRDCPSNRKSADPRTKSPDLSVAALAKAARGPAKITIYRDSTSNL